MDSIDITPRWAEVLVRAARLVSFPNSNASSEQWAGDLLVKVGDFLDKHREEFPMIPPGEYFEHFYGTKPAANRSRKGKVCHAN